MSNISQIFAKYHFDFDFIFHLMWNIQLSWLVRSCFLLFAHSRGSQEKPRRKTFSQISQNDDDDNVDDGHDDVGYDHGENF